MKGEGSILYKFIAPIHRRIRASPHAHRLAKGSFWSILGSVAGRLLAMVAAITAARILGKPVFGELGIIQSTVAMFGTLAGFGLGMTTAKYVAELRGSEPARAGRVIALCSTVSWLASVPLAIVLFAVAPWLCVHTLHAPDLVVPLRVSGFLLVFSSVGGSQTGVLTGFEGFKLIALLNSVVAIINFPAVVLGAYYFGLQGAVWGMVISQAAGCFVNYRALLRETKRNGITIDYSNSLGEIPILWEFSIPAVLGNMVIVPVNWACAALLIRRSGGFAQMGAYNAANQWFNALLWLPYMLGNVLLPMLSEGFGAKDKAKSAKLLTTSIKINALTTLPIIAVACVASPYIMGFYGHDFAREWPTLVAVLLTAGLVGIQVPVSEVIAASGRMWMGLFMNIGWSAAMLCATWSLLGWGAFGLACARLIAFAVHSIWTFAYARTVIRNSGASRAPFPEAKTL